MLNMESWLSSLQVQFTLWRKIARRSGISIQTEHNNRWETFVLCL
jgi:hypothetical protein